MKTIDVAPKYKSFFNIALKFILIVGVISGVASIIEKVAEDRGVTAEGDKKNDS